MCHGITGNIYPLLYLAKVTEEKKWKERAFKLALLSFRPDIVEKFKDIPEAGRIIIGESDRPYSLMEGIGGDMILYADLIGEKCDFPAF